MRFRKTSPQVHPRQAIRMRALEAGMALGFEGLARLTLEQGAELPIGAWYPELAPLTKRERLALRMDLADIFRAQNKSPLEARS